MVHGVVHGGVRPPAQRASWLGENAECGVKNPTCAFVTEPQRTQRKDFLSVQRTYRADKEALLENRPLTDSPEMIPPLRSLRLERVPALAGRAGGERE